MAAYTKAFQKGCDEITMHLSPVVAPTASEIFKFQLGTFDKVWSAFFKLGSMAQEPRRQECKIAFLRTALDLLSSTKIIST